MTVASYRLEDKTADHSTDRPLHNGSAREGTETNSH